MIKLACVVLLVLGGMAAGPAIADNSPEAEAVTDPDMEVVDRIVAVVNDDIILLSELEKALGPYEEAIKKRGLPADTEKELLYKAREDILNQLIDRELTRQKSAELGITVDEAQVDNALERMKQSMQYTEEALQELLAEQGYTLGEYRQHIRDQLLRERLLMREIKAKTIVTQEDIEAYFEDHKAEYGEAEKYHLRNIILQEPSDAPEMKSYETVEEQMNAIIKKLENGASFAALAKKYSQSSFAEDGGDLGLFVLNDLAPDIKTAIQAISPGEFTGMLKTAQGYQIFYLQKIVEPDDKVLDTAAEEIRRKLYDKELESRFEEWVQALREKSHIKIIR
ncbi:MAG: SurA N-terminal domain-containing protein [Thermodesulfobacteriota bacterium]|nr:SurA N-terminal domain-containing protein [Thermodesulfobacteriota bacterium]